MSETPFVHWKTMKQTRPSITSFVKSLGPVEQGQVVASTGVIVTMVTIVSAMLATGQTPRLMDFISILAVGTIGFTGVYFSLKHSRQLDEQRRQLLTLNTIAEAVNRISNLDHVLQTALDTSTELLRCQCGWIYMLEGDSLILKSARGTELDFLKLLGATEPTAWLHQPRVALGRNNGDARRIPEELKAMGIQFWVSIPLQGQESVSGTLILAGSNADVLSPKQADLVEAIGNQISVAMTNAELFELLRQSEQKYIDLFENAPDIYLSIGRNHDVVSLNSVGAEILGYTKAEIVGHRVDVLFTAERRPLAQLMINEMFTDARALKDVEEVLVRKNGDLLHVTLNSSLVLDDDGMSITARIVARDITERKKMEEAILHAQKIDSIGNLAGGIAHDFNNVLASILGSASIMRRRSREDDKFYKYVEIIEVAARRGSSLTRQLLTFARKTEVDVKTVDISSVIKETLALVERSFSKEIVVVSNFASEGTNVSGDDGQLQQAFLNLLLNARDAMPTGGTITITTSITYADARSSGQFASIKPGMFVCVTIADTGCGIVTGIRHRIFEPFFTTKDNGTGLGLSVLHGVVLNHGGFVTLESEVGRGTTFHVFLPRTLAGASTSAARRRQRMPRGSESILIIDDEISVCEIARDMLTDLGYSVSYVHDGRSGVEYYRTRQASIDLVLLDINMPHMGGRQAFEELRAVNAQTRIILLTGYGKDSVETSSLPLEAHGFLQKPFQVEDLAAKVRAALDMKRSGVGTAS